MCARGLAAAILALAAALATVPAQAQTSPAEAAGIDAKRRELQDRLSALRQQAAESAERQAALDAGLSDLESDRADLDSRLLRLADRVARLERQALTAEDRLAVLTDDKARVEATLRERRAVLGTLLGGLQRLGRRPPPAALVRPDDAISAVRGAILMRASLPDLAAEADALRDDLETLEATTADIAREWQRFRTDLDNLAATRLKLDDAIAENQREHAVAALDLETERRRSRALARQVESLSDLLSGGPSAPSRARDGKPLTRALPFDDLRGRLPLPVAGTVVQSFKAASFGGKPSEGVVLAAADQATVFAPADATVAFAGPFRSYGQLLILDVGDGYHVVLAGLDSLTVDVGQIVVAGEPVGRMGSVMRHSPVTLGIRSARPTLYVEFRKNGEVVDPSPWWASPSVASREVGE